MPIFSPPVVNDLPAILPETRGVQRRLWRHYGGNPRGVSVLKIGGVYQTITTPTTAQIDSATEYYAGGHVYVVSAAVSAALIAAGYTTADIFLGLESGDSFVTEGGDSLISEGT